MKPVSRRKKVCFYVSDISEFGGIGRVTRIIAEHLSCESDVYILTLNCANEVSLPFLKSPIRVQYSHRVRLLSVFVHCVRDVRHFLKQNKIDILVSCTEMLSPVCWFAAVGTGVSVVCWFHSNANVFNEFRFQRFCRFFAAKTSSAIVTLTPQMLKVVLSKYNSKRVNCIPNPVDPVLLKPIVYKSTSKRIISVGRLCYAKNFELLVEIAAVLLKKHPDWSWDIFGEGSHRNAIEQLIDNLGIRSQLHLCGAVEDIYSRYSDYAFQVMTSRYEGFPMTLLEGMACGLPLISFDVNAGPRMIIENGVNGFLVSACNKEAMIKAVDELICNGALREKFSSENAIRRFKFDIVEITKKWLDMFNALT